MCTGWYNPDSIPVFLIAVIRNSKAEWVISMFLTVAFAVNFKGLPELTLAAFPSALTIMDTTGTFLSRTITLISANLAGFFPEAAQAIRAPRDSSPAMVSIPSVPIKVPSLCSVSMVQITSFFFSSTRPDPPPSLAGCKFFPG